MRTSRLSTRLEFAVCVALTLFATAGDARASTVEAEIQARIETIRAGGALAIGGDAISSRTVLPAFYEARAFAPAWNDPATRADLLRAVVDIEADGLDPATYHRAELERAFASEPASPRDHAERDLLATDALIRLGYHLLRGRVDPQSLDANWNFTGNLDGIEPVKLLESAIASGRLYDAIEGQKPRHPLYLALKTALADYRRLAANGGWTTVPEIGRLDVGAADPRIPALRRRLAVTGELPAPASTDSDLYDAEVVAAVRAFQRTHGLTDDGVAGARTVAAMNVPVAQRIDQIRLNLERGRWVLRGLEDDFVAVNIAAFRVYVVQGGKPVWTTRAVVGKYHHESPVFKASMLYIVLNPTWTVPPSIAAGELLPKLRKDRGYLDSVHMELLDSSGAAVDPATADIEGAAGRRYTFRQQPGPWNALGQVKFMFPNEHNVYLHDTPSRDLFSREVRTFSHGCIRVENPLQLAEVLLAGDRAWDRAVIDATIAAGDTTTVSLERPLPVLILYWTAWVNPEGELKFYDDVYGRDARVLKELGS
ncbi:MAG: murein L,D-transpeptidase [Thermoanaerobaculia bacterium]